MWSPTLYTLSLRAVQLVFSVPVFCYHLGSFSSLRRVASHISFYQFYLRAFKMPMAQSLLRTACAERTYEHFFYSFSHAYVLTRTLAHSVSKTESRDQSMVLYGIAWKKKPNRQPYRSSKMEHFQPRICFIFMTISRCRCRCCRRRMHSGWLRFRLFTVHLLAQSGIHRCRSPFLLHCRWSDCWCWCRYCWLSCTHSFSLYLYLFQFTAPHPKPTLSPLSVLLSPCVLPKRNVFL